MDEPPLLAVTPPMRERLRDLSVLVIDDSQFTTRLVAEIFRRWGVKSVRSVNEVGDAWRAACTHAFDLILVDWRMPPDNGLAFVRRLRKEEGPNRRAPVIMLTGHAEKPRVLEAREAGVNDFLVKPVSPKTLYRRVRQVLTDPDRIKRAGADAA